MCIPPKCKNKLNLFWQTVRKKSGNLDNKSHAWVENLQLTSYIKLYPSIPLPIIES